VERGIYFDGSYPGQHHYHPSLPPRPLKIVHDLAAYHATVTCRSALGRGAVSLPLLEEEEAFGKVPARCRIYGFMNDAVRTGHPVRPDFAIRLRQDTSGRVERQLGKQPPECHLPADAGRQRVRGLPSDRSYRGLQCQHAADEVRSQRRSARPGWEQVRDRRIMKQLPADRTGTVTGYSQAS
jgi:hypothetical protein